MDLELFSLCVKYILAVIICQKLTHHGNNIENHLLIYQCILIFNLFHDSLKFKYIISKINIDNSQRLVLTCSSNFYFYCFCMNARTAYTFGGSMTQNELIDTYVCESELYLFNTGNARKAWLTLGCHYIEEVAMFRFLTWAPHAKSVSLVGNFNNWSPDANPMLEIKGGFWCTFVSNLHNGDLYKFAIQDQTGKVHLKADPFASWAECEPEHASKVYIDKGFHWTDRSYLQSRSNVNVFSSPISIYEVHIGSWQEVSSDKSAIFRSIAHPLASYCSRMGFTHVEFLPLNEFPYEGSWGYQITGYYAITSRYGTPEDFKYLIDTLHKENIGVILDWVPGHFPKDDYALANFDGTPLYECKEKRMAEHPEWGTLIFDYSLPEVQSFLISSACQLFDVYHIDGVRVDAVSSMLYLDYGRKPGEWTPNKDGTNINLSAVSFLQKFNSTVLTTYPWAITIAEESTAYPMVTYPPSSGGLGFSFKWDMGFMHDTLDYMSIDPYFRSKCHDKLTFSMMYAFSENFILAYSHDEVVHGKCSMINKMWGDYDVKFASLRTLYGFVFAHPGKKHIFMGSEFAQFIEWNYKQNLDWMLLDYPRHRQIQQYYRDLNYFYRSHPAMYEIDRSWEGFKWLNVNDNERSCIAFLRMTKNMDKWDYLVCACNFTPVDYEDFQIALPVFGKLTQIFSSNDKKYGGNGKGNPEPIFAQGVPFLDMNYSATIKLPGFSCIFFRLDPTQKRIAKNYSVKDVSEYGAAEMNGCLSGKKANKK